MKKVLSIILIISLFSVSFVNAEDKNEKNIINNEEVVKTKESNSFNLENKATISEIQDSEDVMSDEVENEEELEENEELEKAEDTKVVEEPKEAEESVETKDVNEIATISVLKNELYGTVGETDLDRAKWECIQDIKDISYFDFTKDDTLTMTENFTNWINECDTYLNGDDEYNVDGFLHETSKREFFMYEYNGELIKKTAVRKTKELLENLKDESDIDACTNMTSEESTYKTEIYTLYTEGNNQYMADWRDENSARQDADFKDILEERGFAINEIDGSNNVINANRTIQVYDWGTGGMVDVESNAIAVHISTNDFAYIVNTGSFTINSDIAKIKFSENCLNNIMNSDKFNPTSNYNGAESLYINISVLKKDYVDGNEELNENQSRLLRALDKSFVDLVVKNARGEKINLNGGEVEVSIPYELTDGEEDDATIWYVNSEGKLEYHKATYKDGFVTFTTTHFSPYFQYKGIRKSKTIWDE